MLAITIQDVFEQLTVIVGTLWDVFGDCATTIISNPLLLVPVVLGFGGSIVLFALGIIRRFGVRGISSSGRRRRR